jgi:molybdate transport system substrate-binding protein
LSGQRRRAAEELSVLSAGAAQSVATALAARHGIELRGEFGAVGAMRQRLLEGAPCDLIVLTRKMIEELAGERRIIASADLGRVPTCVAVREGDSLPDLSDLRGALAAAEAIYYPDPEQATAGMHFQKVLEALGVKGNRMTFPNGAAAMREMAGAGGKVIGCTQATEILATPGLRLAGPLPGEFSLTTTYSVGVCAGAAHAGAAHRFLALLAGEDSRALRMKAGFDLT